MTLLPIVERELRVAARRAGSYRGRVAAAGIALLLAAAVYWIDRSLPAAELGLALFVVLSLLTLLCSLLAGAIFTADSLCAEHREGTLGLLFLTDLRGHDVVLGKLAAATVPALFSLLAILPVITLAVLFGGVSGTAVWQVSVALLAALLFSLSLGISVSLWFCEAPKALVATLALTALVVLGPWLPLAWVQGGLQFGLSPHLLVCPVVPFLGALENLFRPMIRGTGPTVIAHLFWPSVAGLAVLSGLLLALAGAALQWSWHEHPGAWQRWWRTRRSLRPARRARQQRARWLEDNPYLWLSLRRPGRVAAAWSTIAVVVAAAGYGYLAHDRTWDWDGQAFMLSILAHLGISVALALAVGNQLSEDRRGGGLELLLSTPLAAPLILDGQMRAMRRLYGGPVAAILLGDLVLVAWVADDLFTEPVPALLLVLGRMTLLVADCVAITWLATWAALGGGGVLRAAGAALFRVWLAPWGLLLLLLVLANVFDFESALSETVVLAVWLVVRLGNNVFWLRLARRRMAARFRAVADGEPGGENWLWRWVTLR